MKDPCLNPEDLERRATWLELFYDLIYVVAIAKLSHLITHAHGGHLARNDFLLFIVLFVPIWWAWTDHTMFTNRYHPNDHVHRVLTLVQMLCLTVTAAFVETAFDRGGAGFALSYASIRLVGGVMYVRLYFSSGFLKPVAARFIFGISLAVLLWVGSVFFDYPWRYVIWAAAVVTDFATPLSIRRYLSEISFHATHLPERMGLLTIIVLGESVLGIVFGLEHGLHVDARFIVSSLGGFILLSAVWWIYFENLENLLVGRDLTFQELGLLIYGHLPLYVGLVTLASGIRLGDPRGKLPRSITGCYWAEDCCFSTFRFRRSAVLCWKNRFEGIF